MTNIVPTGSGQTYRISDSTSDWRYHDHHRRSPADHPGPHRGTVDLCIAVAGATSGMIVAATDYTVLAVTGGVVALSIVPALALSARLKAQANPLTGERNGNRRRAAVTGVSFGDGVRRCIGAEAAVSGSTARIKARPILLVAWNPPVVVGMALPRRYRWT